MFRDGDEVGRMSPHTEALQRGLIRLVRSALALWEKWIDASKA
jgi:hypothetical protein